MELTAAAAAAEDGMASEVAQAATLGDLMAGTRAVAVGVVVVVVSEAADWAVLQAVVLEAVKTEVAS